MKKRMMLALALYYISSFSKVAALPPSKLPNRDDPSTLLGPTLKGKYTSPLTDNTAYSLLGELGFKNIRIGGTLGWRLNLNQRLKFSAEYLWQEITYSFFFGNSNQWVNQGALGLDYQYDFLGYIFDPAFNFNAYFSHATGNSLNNETGIYINPLGSTRAYVDQRRVAGSNAAGLAPGISFSPWINARIGFEVTYDNALYQNTYVSDHHPQGLGVTFKLRQDFNDYVFIDFSAAQRPPFNHYAAKIGWINIPYYGGSWVFGFDAAYTVGKETLPNTWNVGLTLDYLLIPCPTSVPLHLNNNYKDEVVPAPIDDHFLPWVAKPGVYMPQVLSIFDEEVRTEPVT